MIPPRLTAILVACALMAPAVGLAASPKTECCCPEPAVADRPAGPAIEGRCCCDLDREGALVDATPIVGIAPDGPIAIDPPGLAFAELAVVLPRSVRVPQPRGPPPRQTLLSQRTSLLR